MSSNRAARDVPEGGRRKKQSKPKWARSRYDIQSLESRTLLADLAWSSYLGGASTDVVNSIATDAAGNKWVTGYTLSSEWAVGGFDTSFNGGEDAFVAKINADGSLAWSSYLGGAGDDRGRGIVVDNSGNAWVTGSTTAGGWAVGGADTNYNGGSEDAFVAKINPDGTLAWTSYLGGTTVDRGNGLAIDSSGNAWITGETGFLTTGWTVGGFDTTYNGGSEDAFIAKFDSNGNLAWSSYLGGTSFDIGRSVAIDSLGNAWIVGNTASTAWTTGGFDTSFNGISDAFVAKVNSDGTLGWTTYLGGTRDDAFLSTQIAIDAGGNAWVTGDTSSNGWTIGGFDTSFNGGSADAFVAKVNANGSLAWSTYIGGGGLDYGNAIAVDPAGDVWIAGYTSFSTWVTGGFDNTPEGESDGFVAKINANGSLNWSSFLGGAKSDEVTSITIDASGDTFVAGSTKSIDWAVGGFDTNYKNGTDGFIAEITDFDITPPRVMASSYAFEIIPNHVRLRFTENILNSLAATDVVVTEVPTGTPVGISGFTYDSTTKWASFDVTTLLADGNYRVLLSHDSVVDAVGHPLPSDFTFDFFILSADANRDRKVDLYDLTILATHWQQTGMTFSQGDFNYDTVVNSADLAILATHWQGRLDPPPVPAPPLATSPSPIRPPARTPTRVVASVIEISARVL